MLAYGLNERMAWKAEHLREESQVGLFMFRGTRGRLQPATPLEVDEIPRLVFNLGECLSRHGGAVSECGVNPAGGPNPSLEGRSRLGVTSPIPGGSWRC
jgi:hypothetical protein